MSALLKSPQILKATVQVFAFEGGYNVCNVLQRLLSARDRWIIDDNYSDARYFREQAVRADFRPYASRLMRNLNI